MKKMFLLILALSVLSLGMGKKPASDAGAVAEPKAASEQDGSSQAAPLFTVKDLNGKEVSLKEFKDKKAVLLVFWATWCVYCRQEIPELIKLKEQLKDKNIEIFGVNIQETPAKIKKRTRSTTQYSLMKKAKWQGPTTCRAFRRMCLLIKRVMSSSSGVLEKS